MEGGKEVSDRWTGWKSPSLKFLDQSLVQPMADSDPETSPFGFAKVSKVNPFGCENIWGHGSRFLGFRVGLTL